MGDELSDNGSVRQWTSTDNDGPFPQVSACM
jgi:hypothetical protein